MLLNHPQTVPHSQSMEKLSSPKVIPGVRKFGESDVRVLNLTLEA